MACVIDFLRAYAFENGVRADSVGQRLDPIDAGIAALGDDVGRAEFEREVLPRLVAAHRDDPRGAHLFGGEHAHEPDRAVADDHDRRAGLNARRVGRVPAGAEHVRSRKQARNEIVRRQTRCVATSVPSASGTRASGACAPLMNSRCWHDD